MTTKANKFDRVIRRLAKLNGVQTAYTDASGATVEATAESLREVLGAMGTPVKTEAAALAAERRMLGSIGEQWLAPVIAAWEGRANHAPILAGQAGAATPVRWELTLEDGSRRFGSERLGSLRCRSIRGLSGVSQRFAMLPLSGGPTKGLPPGYHTLRVRLGRRDGEAMVVCAPVKSFRHPAGVCEREWGVFAPVYSLRSSGDMGVGDLSDLGALASFGGELGGRVVATLPLLASFMGERAGPFDPSPYAPVSRLFWNELFIDPRALPELAGCDAARRKLVSAPVKHGVAALRRGGLVDYRKAAGLKRAVLEPIAETFFRGGGEKTPAFGAFVRENPLAKDYAWFRAATELTGEAWGEWRSGKRGPGRRLSGAGASAERYHLFVQFAFARQLAHLAGELKSRGGLLYLDLPVGVSPFGFDTWKNPGLFAGCSTGAPPDPYFTGGQNWGFPPMHPRACREQRYAYLIGALRNHMRHADYLRLDHVMAFHRLFWVPDGGSAADGVYVRYEAEEIYAILSLESHRNRCRLVGENLGTVPPEVNRALDRHDLCGLYVAQYEMQPSAARALRPVPANCVASVNTHDMPPIATSWSGRDVDDRIKLDMLAAHKREGEMDARARLRESVVAFLRKRGLLDAGLNGQAVAPGAAAAGAVRDAVLDFLGDSPADFVLVNLEDLWLETQWQNVPGTMDTHPNWRRKLRLTLEQLAKSTEIAAMLKRLHAVRKPAGRSAGADARGGVRRLAGASNG